MSMLTKVKSLRVATLVGVPQQRGHKDGPLTSALFADPTGICVSEEGDVFVTDSGNHRIRRFTLNADGLVETVAGCGQAGRKDGPALAAKLSKPSGICFGVNGGIIFVEEAGCTLRTLINGEVATIIGSAGSGFADGPVATAMLRSPRGVCQAPDGTIYIADNGNHRVRRVDTNGIVHSIGSGAAACADGDILTGSMLYPSSVCVAPSGTIYAGELYRVRRILLDENVIVTHETTSDSSLTAAVVPSPAFDNRIFYTDSNGCRIMSLNEKGKVKLIAGAGRGGGFLDGSATESKFSSPHGIAFTPDGDLLICDSNHCIRIIRDIYPPTERSLPSAASFSLSHLLDLPASSSTSPSSPLLPFHPNLAALAYPSLATITSADLAKASLHKNVHYFNLEDIGSNDTELHIPNAEKCLLEESIDARIRSLYTVLGAERKANITCLLSALHLTEALNMPLELIQLIAKRFTFALGRATLSPSGLTELLISIATADLSSSHAAYLIVDKLKASGAVAAQVLPRLEESIKSEFPEFYDFVSELLGEKLSSSSRSLLKSAFSGSQRSKSPSKASSSSLSSYSSLLSSIGSTPATSSASHSKSKRKSGIVSPYLISRCTSLFWAKVAPTLSKTFAPALVGLKELVEPPQSSDILTRPKGLLNPEFTIIIDDHSIKCHDWILYARWPWFRALVKSGMQESQSGTVTIPSSSFSYTGFVALLYYIYSHRTDMFSPPLCAELLRCAEEFRLVELLSRPFAPEPEFEVLIRHCQRNLTPDLTADNFVERLKLARELGIQPAIDTIISFISHNVSAIYASKSSWEEILRLDAEIIKDIFIAIPWDQLTTKPF